MLLAKVIPLPRDRYGDDGAIHSLRKNNATNSWKRYAS